MTPASPLPSTDQLGATPALKRSGPPFRADHVGSFLRPLVLEQGRAKYAAGQLDDAGLQRVEDAAIAEVVQFQEGLGVRAITDGEYRRAYFHLDFLGQIQGFEAYQDAASTHFHTCSGCTLDFSPPKLRVVSKLNRPRPIMVRDHAYIASQIQGDAVAKITIPSPTMALRGGRKQVDAVAYPDLADFHADLTAIYRGEVADLAAAGCGYLQLDDTNLAYLCDENQREKARLQGDDPDTLPTAYAKLINDALAGAPAEMFTAIHLCRGNFKSAFVAEGGYDPVAEVLFNEIDVDAFLLEYEDDRSGDFTPLRFVPKGKYVVLGLVSSKLPQLETKDEIKRRIDEAAKYVPLDQLALSPQCGFASTEHGNDISFDDQRRKMELVVEVAREVWGAA